MLQARNTYAPTHGLASASRMRTAISPGQLQPWTAVSPLLGHSRRVLERANSRPDGYAMLMSPNKGEAAVHGCHYPCDMAVRTREVLSRP